MPHVLNFKSTNFGRNFVLESTILLEQFNVYTSKYLNVVAEVQKVYLFTTWH